VVRGSRHATESNRVEKESTLGGRERRSNAKIKQQTKEKGEKKNKARACPPSKKLRKDLVHRRGK